MAIESIAQSVLLAIGRLAAGSVFFASDFGAYGDTRTINRYLERLQVGGEVIRVAKGIYCKPEHDVRFGLGVLYPSLDDVAHAIARRDGCTLLPTGDMALWRLGLSSQAPLSAVYMTDGCARTVTVYDGQCIQFRRVSPKLVRFKHRLPMLITMALKTIGRDNLTAQQVGRIRQLLCHEPKANIEGDLPIMPMWIRKVVTDSYA